MYTSYEHTRREHHELKLFSYSVYRHLSPFLGKLTLLILFPAFSYGCGGAAGKLSPAYSTCTTKVMVSDMLERIRTLDIFMFRDDEFQKLDCYQRFEGMEEWAGTIVSGSGERILTAIANSGYTSDDWMRLNSRPYLKGIYVSLEDERRENLCMTGEIRVKTSELPVKNLILAPLAGEVILNSISCDFTGRPYAGEKLTDVRVYLTNVNAECLLLDGYGTAPRRIINGGGLKEEDVENFLEPDIVLQDLSESVGTKTVYPDVRLLCYPSSHPKEGPGTPFTRLVIEGKVSGRTYYWPVNINRDTDFEAGIWSNRSYIFDIRITRKGSTDPDTPVKAEDIIINQTVREWEEKEDYQEFF